MKSLTSFLGFWQSYRRQKRDFSEGFTLMELIITLLIASILAAVAYPMIINQIGKARVAEAKNGLGAINRAQQAYLFENSQFAQSLEDLYVDFTFGHYESGTFVTKYYIYSITNTPNNNQVHHAAQPISGEIYNTRRVVSAVFHQPTYFLMVICEASLPNSIPEIVDPNTCNNGRFIR